MNECTYNLTEPPRFVTTWTDAQSTDASVIKWSGGTRQPPKLGTRVRVNFNGLGTGVVRSYFVEHGYLGVALKLDNPPEFFIRQNARQEATAPLKDRCGVFGAEITTIDEEAA